MHGITVFSSPTICKLKALPDLILLFNYELFLIIFYQNILANNNSHIFVATPSTLKESLNGHIFAFQETGNLLTNADSSTNIFLFRWRQKEADSKVMET